MEEEYGQAGQDNLQAIEFQLKHFLIIVIVNSHHTSIAT